MIDVWRAQFAFEIYHYIANNLILPSMQLFFGISNYAIDLFQAQGIVKEYDVYKK